MARDGSTFIFFVLIIRRRRKEKREKGREKGRERTVHGWSGGWVGQEEKRFNHDIVIDDSGPHYSAAGTV